jgi:hypothetical protein
MYNPEAWRDTISRLNKLPELIKLFYPHFESNLHSTGHDFILG